MSYDIGQLLHITQIKGSAVAKFIPRPISICYVYDFIGMQINVACMLRQQCKKFRHNDDNAKKNKRHW